MQELKMIVDEENSPITLCRDWAKQIIGQANNQLKPVNLGVSGKREREKNIVWNMGEIWYFFPPTLTDQKLCQTPEWRR